MTETSGIDGATKRLTLALDSLEAAAERRREADDTQHGLVDQVHALGADRSRLASDLDVATARARALESTNQEVARRLEAAIDTIRSLIEAHND